MYFWLYLSLQGWCWILKKKPKFKEQAFSFWGSKFQPDLFHFTLEIKKHTKIKNSVWRAFSFCFHMWVRTEMVRLRYVKVWYRSHRLLNDLNGHIADIIVNLNEFQYCDLIKLIQFNLIIKIMNKIDFNVSLS